MQKLILENRSVETMEEVLRVLPDVGEVFGASHGNTWIYGDASLYATVYHNKKSTRLVFHHNDGVDHREDTP